ncbi:MAG: hypothetical protein GY953_15460 [bacterium]|nr:hypothetical protein [bacterium]
MSLSEALSKFLPELRICARLTLAASLAALPAAASAEYRLFPFDAELSHYVENYGAKPAPANALERLLVMDVSAFEERAAEATEPHSRAALMAFYVHVLRQHPDLVLDFARELVKRTSGGTAAFGAETIAYAGGPDRDEALGIVAEGFRLSEEYAKRLLDLPVFSYREIPVESGQALDLLWACFYATGDHYYLRRIAEPLVGHPLESAVAANRIGVLAADKPAPGSTAHGEILRLAYGEAARMGLLEHSQRLDAVRKFLEAESQVPDSPLRDIARALLQEGAVPD